MGTHAVHCPPGGDEVHELVRIRLVDGQVFAEVEVPGRGAGEGTTSRSLIARSTVPAPYVVVVACPCGEFGFDVGGYLAGEWVEPVELGD
jgi:hypothetical protein